jgi:hypothetical protein
MARTYAYITTAESRRMRKHITMLLSSIFGEQRYGINARAANACYKCYVTGKKACVRRW